MDRISFIVNGVRCHVGAEVSSDLTLVDYLRSYLGLRGTKYMCREGGCGACIVTVVKNRGEDPISVNACLVAVTSCYNWEITTVEDLGNREDGFHAIQTALADVNGTQCGYCTPGWVMAMYSLTKGSKALTMNEIEKSFASNLCRCTGYRPILEAFRKFGSDAPRSIKITDIEDFPKCKKNGRVCTKKCCSDEDEWCMVVREDVPNILEINLSDGKFWFRVSTVADIFDVLERKGDSSYMLVAGNTGKGVIPMNENPNVIIDVSGVPELKGHSKDQNLIINAGTTLTELLQIFNTESEDEDFAYLKQFYDHVTLIGHLGIRNIGTMAGNVMIKHASNNSGSDLFLLWELVDGQIVLRDRNGEQSYSMPEFLKVDMRGKVIVKFVLPPLGQDYKVISYKIMQRAQNTRAVVNAGFLYRLGTDNIVRQCKILFTSLHQPYHRGQATEQFLIGKNLFTNDTLQSAARILENEITVNDSPPEPSGAFKKQLALGLFYKALLTICPTDLLNSRYRSGSTDLHKERPVSSGQQVFETNSELWPLNQPMPKIEALKQCAGEVQYTEDMPSYPHEVYAAFVLSTVGKGTIANIDATEALNHPGVIAFYTAKDIPGLNSFTPADYAFYSANEEVISSGSIEYFNQPIGIIVANTRAIADRAAKLVNVTYRNTRAPVIDIKVAKDDQSRVVEYLAVDATNRGSDVDKVISGQNVAYGQYHFAMETLVCVTNPSEDGLEVYSATQWMDGTQLMISRALNIDQHCIDVSVRRLGGAYGIKISRATQVAVACSLVAWKLNRPCRFIQSLSTNMRAVGKRLPCVTEFQASVSAQGVIQHVDYNLYLDNGYKTNELLYLLGSHLYYNVYDVTRWTFKGYNVTTDTHKNTWCRAPGSLEAVSMAEYMMERIAYEQNVDPIQVRIANVDTATHNEVIDLYHQLEAKADFQQRRAAVERFNSENRWKKRGLRAAFMRWEPMGGQRLQCSISVYHNDGSIAIQHSGIEMGQGINTRATQIAAHLLGVPVEKIIIKGSNTIVGPNAFITGGDLASSNITIAIQRACTDLQTKLQPVRDKFPNASWEEIVSNAYNEDINLQGHGFVNFNDIVEYYVYGVAFCEVEVDILTGQHEVLRIDLLEDAGRPINPELEIGQIEGAFTMALGYWTCENIVHDQNTGEILTDRAWHYYIPQARDIPRDFRITLKERGFSSDNILGAKAAGEAPMLLGIVVTFALREAIAAARVDAGRPRTEWFDIDGPFTVEKTVLNSLTSTEHFRYS